MRTIKPRKLHLNESIEEKTEVTKTKTHNYKKNKEISIPTLIILVIMLSLISGCLGAYFVLSALNIDTKFQGGGITISNAPLKETNSIASAVNAIYDAVVVVEVYDNQGGLETGTGFIYNKEADKAYIITNNHVVSKGKTIKVLFTDGTELEAEKIGSDTYSDIAVLSVKDSKKIVQAVMGKSQSLKVGDTVFAVGSPEGSDYAGTVTKGVLSGKERLIAVSLEDSKTLDYYMEVLQTDAAINPGNSGGPLCNTNGEVIGITSMKLVDNTIEGMGFAIPIEKALEVAEVLKTEGKITRPKLGISIAPVSKKFEIYYQFGILVPNDIEEGLVLLNVETGSPADKAGLQKGDIIIKLEGTKATDTAKFQFELHKYSPGDKIEITYIRNNKEKTTKLTLNK